MSEYTIEEVHSVNDEWDDFFKVVCASYKFLVRRDAEYVKWRYLDYPDRVHRVFSVRKEGCIIGWSVFTGKDNRIIWGMHFLIKGIRRLPSACCKVFLKKNIFRKSGP